QLIKKNDEIKDEIVIQEKNRVLENIRTYDKPQFPC
ncbi:alkaline phosphatase, partial [Legionella pneumophila]